MSWKVFACVVVALLLFGCGPKEPPQAPLARAETQYQPEQQPEVQPLPPVKSFEICFPAMSARVPVIMYHDIVESRGPGTVWFDSTVAEFKDQMHRLQDEGYKAISLDDLHRHLTEGFELPPKTIVLTFDDNYQGFYDYAWPVLKEMGFPAAMFVHTGFVGTKTGRAHMTWDTLKELSKDPLMTIGSHTVTHPELPKLSPDEQTKELVNSKADLEEHLGKTIDYFAYPDGKNDAATQELAKSAGYKMSFSIENGPAEESPSIECINRYVQTRFDRALKECEDNMQGAVGVFTGIVKDGPVSFKEDAEDGKTLAMVIGGRAASVVSPAREGVLDFIHRSGAVAGINGTFFDMAAISSTDNKLVGPCKTADAATLIPDNEPWRWPKLRNRPLILWGPTHAAIVPYNPARMNDELAFHDFMPDYTDTFLAGGWLVHSGQALTKEQMQMFASKDIEDPRRRAAFGFMADGSPVAVACKDSVASSEFAVMLSKAGVQEAVLLDSGFSTSLVYGEKIMASGHSTPDKPSRPVPHAIVFRGALDPASQAAAAAAVPATNPIPESNTPVKHRRRRRRKATTESPETPVTPDTTAPPPSAILPDKPPPK